ncbi:MAG TPA: zinc ribbon domain-containing protein [Planctomycetota bacterium]|nr:zinc ribbon domain-containing protein [Planctomycetota bacterium]
MIFHCPFCGLKTRPGERICRGCGRTMVRRCPCCGEEVAADATLCKYCDEELSPVSPEPRPPRRTGHFPK